MKVVYLNNEEKNGSLALAKWGDSINKTSDHLLKMIENLSVEKHYHFCRLGGNGVQVCIGDS